MDQTRRGTIHALQPHFRRCTVTVATARHHCRLSTLADAVFHCEDKQASSLRIFCPRFCFQATEVTFMDTSVFETIPQEPQEIISSLVSILQRQYGKSYPWAISKGRQLPAGYILAKKKKAFQSGRPPLWTLWTHRFVQCPTSWPFLIFQLIPVACPDYFG